jgi:catechol 2,3-dioxygenase-like lactoylglutathione lyase family enzyme
MSSDHPTTSANADDSSGVKKPSFRPWGVRYQVKDVERSVAFYTQYLGFKLEQQAGSAFARISNANLSLLLSGPKASGSRLMPDGRKQEPGGWNRVVLAVTDLPARVEEMKKTGHRFRSEIEAVLVAGRFSLRTPTATSWSYWSRSGSRTSSVLKRRNTMESRIELRKATPAVGKVVAAMRGVERAIADGGLDHSLLNLVRIRASQINGCSY